MEKEEAISAIKNNWPTSNYTMLREALSMAVEALEQMDKPKGGMSAEQLFLLNCSEYEDPEKGHVQYMTRSQFIKAYNQFPSAKVSDEEIRNEAEEIYPGHGKMFECDAFRDGAKWMRSRMSNNKTEL